MPTMTSGQARLRHEAVGLNFADTYFRTGLYPVPLPNGMGVEAAGVVLALRSGLSLESLRRPIVRAEFMDAIPLTKASSR